MAPKTYDYEYEVPTVVWWGMQTEPMDSRIVGDWMEVRMALAQDVIQYDSDKYLFRFPSAEARDKGRKILEGLEAKMTVKYTYEIPERLIVGKAWQPMSRLIKKMETVGTVVQTTPHGYYHYTVFVKEGNEGRAKKIDGQIKALLATGGE